MLGNKSRSTPILNKPVNSEKQGSRTRSSRFQASKVQNPNVRVIYDLWKGPMDKKEYLGLILENQLKILLISDPTTKISAASLVITIGSMNEPLELPGLAHFCEHMLFFGTEKYKEENGFLRFLDENGGSTNASTAEDHTKFHFDVASDQLRPALDRFVQFFISPLMTAKRVEKEIGAMSAKHRSRIPDDNDRYYEILKATANAKHPFARFTTGNLATLWNTPKDKINFLRDALILFHSTCYSSNLMTVAVLGKESLEDLRTIVEPLFAVIKNNNIQLPRWLKGPYGTNELQMWINMLPIRDLNGMTISFPVPDMSEYYKTDPLSYIENLVQQESKGSLVSLLQKKNWMTQLSAEGGVIASGFGTFDIAIHLTPEGVKHAEEIVMLIFQYLEMFRRKEPIKEFWDEIRAVKEIENRFAENPSPKDHVCWTAWAMSNHPLDEVLKVYSVLTDYNPALITEIMTYLTPENCRVILLSKANEGKLLNLTEKHYGTKYSLKKINQSLIEKWKNCGLHDEFTLPSKNEFVSTDFTIQSKQDVANPLVPSVILEKTFSRAWFYQNPTNPLAKGILRLELYSPLPLQSPLSHALNYMLREIVNDSTASFKYAVTMAGYTFQITATKYGQEILISGCSEKIGIVLERIIDKILSFACDIQRFEALKKQYAQDIKNSDMTKPRYQASLYLNYLLQENEWTNEEIRAIIPDVTIDKLLKYANDFVSAIGLKWVFFGNFTIQGAKEIVSNCHAGFKGKGSQALGSKDQTRPQEIKLEGGADYIYKKEQTNYLDSSLIVFYQSSHQGTREKVLMELLSQIANESFVNQLKTQEQIASKVRCRARVSNGTIGLEIRIQSKFHPEVLECRVDNCLEKLRKLIAIMTDKEFYRHQTELTDRKETLWNSTKNLGENEWAEIQNSDPSFSTHSTEIDIIDRQTPKSILEYFTDLFGPPAEKRRRINIHVLSMMPEGAGTKAIEPLEKNNPNILRAPKIIQDVSAWKNAQNQVKAEEIVSAVKTTVETKSIKSTNISKPLESTAKLLK